MLGELFQFTLWLILKDGPSPIRAGVQYIWRDHQCWFTDTHFSRRAKSSCLWLWLSSWHHCFNGIIDGDPDGNPDQPTNQPTWHSPMNQWTNQPPSQYRQGTAAECTGSGMERGSCLGQATSTTPRSSWSTSDLLVSKATPWLVATLRRHQRQVQKEGNEGNRQFCVSGLPVTECWLPRSVVQPATVPP